ncbi:MAG: JAB domain-containing protein [Negativicutes bacterium]
MDIALLDHVVIGERAYVSMRKNDFI